MNWGKGITIALALFMGFIIVMVVGFFSHSVDLESEDYYQREIAYEDEITALNNVNQLLEKPEIKISESHLIVQFSDSLEFTDAILQLKRPDNQKNDKSFKIENTKMFTIAKEDLTPGVYDLRLSYTIDGKDFLQKKEIYL